ncbi:MAG TPA: hypothetical protein VGR55_00415 [Candidatus Acidoferrum sp.]|nr:hypothetical protein [Candidatus Acidoferrum sp.]
MNIVASLAAGVIGTEYYGLDENGDVYIFDADGHGYKVPEPLAKRVREVIKNAEKTGT